MVFWVLGPSTRAAYLRVARASGVLLACLRALRQAGTRKTIAHAHIFFRQLRAAEARARTIRLAGGRAPPEPPETRKWPARAAP